MNTTTWRSDVRRFTRIQWSVLIVLVLSILTVGVAFAFILQHVAPFSGSIFDPGSVTISTAYTNDDGTQTEPTGFDEGDTGNDPNSPANLVPPYGPAVGREASNIQSCTATITGGTDLSVDLSDTHNPLYCAIKFRVVNASPQPLVYDGATINGAPVLLNQDPHVGECIPSGNQPFMHIELTADPAAAPGTTWNSTTADITFEFHDVASCP